MLFISARTRHARLPPHLPLLSKCQRKVPNSKGLALARQTAAPTLFRGMMDIPTMLAPRIEKPLMDDTRCNNLVGLCMQILAYLGGPKPALQVPKDFF